MKISSFIIGLAIVSLVVGVLGLFTSEMNHSYIMPGYDNSSIQTYNQLNEISNTTKEIKERAENVKEKTGITDIIGSYFGDAYSALKITVKSFGAFQSMTEKAAEDLPLGDAGNLFKVTIIVIIIIALFVGVVMSALLKSDKL